MFGRSHRFLGITSTFWGVKMPCSRTQHGFNRVGLEPRPLHPESEALTTRPLRSPDRPMEGGGQESRKKSEKEAQPQEDSD